MSRAFGKLLQNAPSRRGWGLKPRTPHRHFGAVSATTFSAIVRSVPFSYVPFRYVILQTTAEKIFCLTLSLRDFLTEPFFWVMKASPTVELKNKSKWSYRRFFHFNPKKRTCQEPLQKFFSAKTCVIISFFCLGRNLRTSQTSPIKTKTRRTAY